MRIIDSILHKLSILIQLPLVIIFILFEEVIWEGIAQPIYNKFRSLRVLQKIETKLQVTHRSVILFSFIIIFVIVEAAGIFAGILFVQGQILLGLGLYITKIPIAAFTFWLFKVSKEKLLSYGWFDWIYTKIMTLFEWLKSLEIYQSTMQNVRKVKEIIKTKFRAFKEKYFAEESAFTKRFKRLYIHMKKLFRQE